VRAAVFFNVLKNPEITLKQFVSEFYFSFISHVRASEIRLFISVLCHVVQAALAKVIPILALLSMGRVQTACTPHISIFFQNKILCWPIIMGKMWQQN